MGRADDLKATSAEIERLVDDMRGLGFSQAQIDKAVASVQGRVADPVFRVHPDNVVAVRVLNAMMTQWNVVALSTFGSARIIRTGLKYEAIETTARMAGLEMTPADFARLRTMETAAIEAWSEAR